MIDDSEFQTKGFSESRRFFRRGIHFNTKLIVPINEDSSHWTFVFIDPHQKELHYYNSFNTDGMDKMLVILDFIEEEHSYSQIPFERASWKLVSHQDSPLQKDGSACGIFAILNAECVALGKSFNHGQDNVPDVRKKIQILLISEGKF